MGILTFMGEGIQLLKILKPIRPLLCEDPFFPIYVNIYKLYTILLSRGLEKQKVAPHTNNHQSKKKKKKNSGINNEILIKYKRMKWTPSCKALHLLPGE